MRLLPTFLCGLVASMPVLAHAGDFAVLDTIGFSRNGQVFAYEQHGYRDGSGFPYSEIFFLDMEKDAFIAPTPVRVSPENDAAKLETARADARRKADKLFKAHRPEAHPGLVVADNPVTEVSADPRRVVFQPRAFEPWPDSPVELKLEEIKVAGGADCPGGKALGYRLTRLPGGDGSPARVLHEDKTVPASRGCPISYAIARVVVSEGDVDETFPQSAVALIGVKMEGFEGPDLRFVSAPVRLD